MAESKFIQEFRSKSNAELEMIAMNGQLFVFDARYAAVTLLKDRNYDSAVISQVEKERACLEKQKNQRAHKLREQDQYLIRRLQKIPLKGAAKYLLKNGNELQVKRLSKDRFRVRIEDGYGSHLAPVLVCRIKNDSTYFCYPSLYLKPILIYGVGGTALMLLLILLDHLENDALVVLLPLITMVGLQLFLLIPIYFVILKVFKKSLGEK